MSTTENFSRCLLLVVGAARGREGTLVGAAGLGLELDHVAPVGGHQGRFELDASDGEVTPQIAQPLRGDLRGVTSKESLAGR